MEIIKAYQQYKYALILRTQTLTSEAAAVFSRIDDSLIEPRLSRALIGHMISPLITLTVKVLCIPLPLSFLGRIPGVL